MADDRGFTSWRAVFDRVTIDKLPAGMRAIKISRGGDVALDEILTADQAAHLARLLVD